MSKTLSLTALQGFPMVRPGDDVAQLVSDSLDANEFGLLAGDVIVLAQKIVSKAEERYVRLSDVEASPRAVELAAEVDKDSRLVELILRESTEVVRY